MKKLFALLAFGMLAAGLLTTTGSAAAGTSQAACASQLPGKIGRFSGIVHAQSIASTSCDPTSPLGSAPPLLFNGGPVMANDPAHPITITPIF